MNPAIEIEKLTDTVGVEVKGIDIQRLLTDDEIPAWLHKTLEAHGVLVFRELFLDDASHAAFSHRLGEVELLGTGEHKEIFIVTLDPAKNPIAPYLRGTFDWHIDGLTDDIPIKATLLSAHAIAEAGGETEFASTYAAYEDLSDEEKERLEPLRVVHSIESSQRRMVSDPTPEQVAMWRSRPAKEQPLIWRHQDGRRSLVLGPTGGDIVGMASDESTALLDDLLDRTTNPERVYRHEWTLGDLVIWDNRGVVHRALPYDPDSAREMHRTTLRGDERIN